MRMAKVGVAIAGLLIGVLANGKLGAGQGVGFSNIFTLDRAGPSDRSVLLP